MGISTDLVRRDRSRFKPHFAHLHPSINISNYFPGLFILFMNQRPKFEC